MGLGEVSSRKKERDSLLCMIRTMHASLRSKATAAYLPDYPPAYLSAKLPTPLPACLPTCLAACLLD